MTCMRNDLWYNDTDNLYIYTGICMHLYLYGLWKIEAIKRSSFLSGRWAPGWKIIFRNSWCNRTSTLESLVLTTDCRGFQRRSSHHFWKGEQLSIYPVESWVAAIHRRDGRSWCISESAWPSRRQLGAAIIDDIRFLGTSWIKAENKLDCFRPTQHVWGFGAQRQANLLGSCNFSVHIQPRPRLKSLYAELMALHPSSLQYAHLSIPKCGGLRASIFHDTVLIKHC